MAEDDDAKEWFRSAAWASFIRWATEKREFQEAYLKASGEAVIADSMERFVMWLTKEHWGVSEAPQRVRAQLAAATEAASHDD